MASLVLTLALTAGSASGGPIPPAPTTTATSIPDHHRAAPTAPPARTPAVWDGTVEWWRPLVAEYFHPDRVDDALSVMACESGGNPDADNPTSTASGLFQHLATYWPERSANAGLAGASIWDPAPNVAVAAWLSNGGTDWSHWVCKP